LATAGAAVPGSDGATWPPISCLITGMPPSRRSRVAFASSTASKPSP
jgi:hypothetical protein